MIDRVTPQPGRSVPRIALSIEEAARALSLSPRTVEELARRGELPAFRVGKRWLFAVQALRRWADEQTAAQAGGEVRP